MVGLWGRRSRRFAALRSAVLDGPFVRGLGCVVPGGLVDIAFLIPAGLFLFDVRVAMLNGVLRRRAVFNGNTNLARSWRVSPGTWALANLIVPRFIAAKLARTRPVRRIEWRGEREAKARHPVAAPELPKREQEAVS